MKRLSERFRETLAGAEITSIDMRKQQVVLGNPTQVIVFDFAKRETRTHLRTFAVVGYPEGLFPSEQGLPMVEPWAPGEGYVFNIHTARWLISEKFDGDEAE